MIAKLCIGLTLVLPATRVFALGAVTGGGGKGVYCTDPNGQVTVEALDLWEARNIFGQSPQLQSGNLQQDVDNALVAIQFAYDIHGDEPVLNRLREVAGRFLQPDTRVLLRHGKPLPLTNDSYEVAQPRDCPVRQIVIFQADGTILIDQDLFGKMNEVNQAALIVHEAFYTLLRERVGERSSIRARRAVGYVFGGHVFATVPFMRLGVGDEAVQCTSGDSQEELVLILKSSDPTRLRILARRLSGSKLLGTDNLPDVFSLSQATAQDFIHQTCTTLGAPLRFNLEGPIEFDRAIELEGGCAHRGVDQSFGFAFSLKTNLPGLDQTHQSALQCRPILPGVNL